MDHKNIDELISYALYKYPDLTIEKPDLNQIAEYLYAQIEAKCEYADFEQSFLLHLADKDRLKGMFYQDIVSDLGSILSDNIKFCAWTQGNLFVQGQKAEIISNEIDNKYLANPHIYTALKKIRILEQVIKDLKSQSCNSFILMDDREENIRAVSELFLKIGLDNYQLIQKARPDRPNQKRIIADNIPNSQICSNWSEIKSVVDTMQNTNPTNIGFICDLDGVIYNTSFYRKGLEQSLKEWLSQY